MNPLVSFGYEFKNVNLCRQAFIHKSFHNENISKGFLHNETLEFLGDAVLDLALADYLMRNHPQLDEGQLSKIRASLVNEHYLAGISKDIGVESAMLLGKGEKQSGGATKPRLLASTFEALIGAVFLDSGYDEAAAVIEKIFKDRIAGIDFTTLYHLDYKTRLQEIIQRKLKVTPEYQLINENGPDHEKTFFVQLKVGDQVLASGEGRSKKLAEQDAAKIALETQVEAQP